MKDKKVCNKEHFHKTPKLIKHKNLLCVFVCENPPSTYLTNRNTQNYVCMLLVFLCVCGCVSAVKYVYVLHKNIIEQIIIKFHTLYNEIPYNITVLWREYKKG